ncbi:peptidoglycan-binding protein, partial [Pseudomonas fragi]|nr:peptidoglycan-binding protein [Pseudomonas sp. GC01]
ASAADGKGAVGDAKNISDKLATTQEGLDSARRENAELQSRMQDLQSQLDKLQRLIELKNNQLAKLQADSSAPVDPAAAIAVPLPGQAVDAPEADIAPADEGAPATAVPPAPAQDDSATPRAERSIQDLLHSPWLL